jgi:hypothetical protein
MSRAFASSLPPSESSSFKTFRITPPKNLSRLMINPPKVSDLRLSPPNHPGNVKAILASIRKFMLVSIAPEFSLDASALLSWTARWVAFAVRFSFEFYLA